MTALGRLAAAVVGRLASAAAGGLSAVGRFPTAAGGLAAALALAIAAATNAAAAPDFVPAIIFDMGGKFDKSFNEAAYHGAEKFKDETGIPYLEFEVTNEAQREQALRGMARAAPIVVGVGFSQAPPLEKVARRVPRTKFVIIDAVVDGPTSSRSCSRSTRAPSWSAWPRPWPRRPARSASSAAWTSR